VPLLLGGDELSHTLNGNNNAYCQDNELTWLNWDLDERQQRFLEFARMVTDIRREQPVFHRRNFFLGRLIRGAGIQDISWFNANGQDMTDADWNAGFVRCLGMRLAGDLIGELDEHGEPIRGETLLLLLNAHHEAIPFALPPTRPDHHWQPVLDTTTDDRERAVIDGGEQYLLQARSFALLRTVVREETSQIITHAQVQTLRKELRTPRHPKEKPALSPI
jgi:glycogen operon protein